MLAEKVSIELIHGPGNIAKSHDMGIHDLKDKTQLGHLVSLARFKIGAGVEFLLAFGPGSKTPRLLSEWHRAVAMIGLESFQGFILRIPRLFVINDEA